MPMEKDYFEARFDGIEKLMTVQEANLKGYIGAVSKNVSEVRADLTEHKENTDAHGAGEGRHLTDSLAKWGSVVLAAIAIVLGIRKNH